MRTNNRPEQAIVRAILEYLTLRRVPHYRTTNTGAMFYRNGKINFGRRQISQVGAPDILGAWKGTPFAIEVKSAEGKLSKEQTEWLWRFQEAGGGLVVVARSVDDVINSLRI